MSATMVQELEQTYEALSVIMQDEATFKYVVGEVFLAVDKDSSGHLTREELLAFISKVCTDMGMKATPDSKAIDEVFKDLDTDNSDDISPAEFSEFLRKLFLSQRDECAKALGKTN